MSQPRLWAVALVAVLTAGVLAVRQWCLASAADPAAAAGPPSTPDAAAPAAEPPADFAGVVRRDPLAALTAAVARYRREAGTGFRCVLLKQERIGDTLHGPEVVDVSVREQPHAVLMRWREGARRAAATLYAAGENADQVVGRPAGSLAQGAMGALRLIGREPFVRFDPDSPLARSGGRYSLREFGLRMGAERTLRDWSAARDRGAFRFEYLGERPIDELGGRRCHEVRRHCDDADRTGIAEATVMLDAETWQQVGVVVRGPGGGLLGSYHFRDVQYNPAFAADEFTTAALLR